MPAAARSPAQAEAARRDSLSSGGRQADPGSARSRGPVTAEGKARSRLNALRHGLAAAEDLLLDGEDPAAWEELLAGLLADHEPAGETGARLVRRLAAALWRQDRADRLERACFIAAPRPRFLTPEGPVHAAPEETFELARLTAISRYRAEASREVSRLLRELRLLRNEPGTAPTAAAAEPRDEPGTPAAAANANARGEPGRPAAAPPPGARNDPEPVAELTPEERPGIERMIASGDPARLVEGARRAGVPDPVLGVVRRAEAAAAGR